MISDVVNAIWERLAPIHLKFPNSEQEWLDIAQQFERRWNYPHCIGALDGKHVTIFAPPNSGSSYFNYKGTFSVVLMALVDANLKFIAVEVGALGRNSDGGIFANSNLGEGFLSGAFRIPADEPLVNGHHLGPMPYVIVADEAFPLKTNIMRPYPGKNLSEGEKIYNYRHSRARRTSENAFGLLANRWRIFHSKIALKPDFASRVVKAACVLHNLCVRASTSTDDTQDLSSTDSDNTVNLQPFKQQPTRPSAEAMYIRDSFKDYFAEISPVEWQSCYIHRGRNDMLT